MAPRSMRTGVSEGLLISQANEEWLAEQEMLAREREQAAGQEMHMQVGEQKSAASASADDTGLDARVLIHRLFGADVIAALDVPSDEAYEDLFESAP